MAEKITVLFDDRKITILYTMFPFWISSFRKKFCFTTNLDWVLRKDKNKNLLLVGWFQKQDRDGRHKMLLVDLGKKYNKIFFVDDNDGSESHFLDLLPYLDKYYKKQVFRDRSIYSRELYGKRIFTHYYHTEFGVDEMPIPESLPKLKNKGDLSKLEVSWNLAFGQYPVSKWKHHSAKLLFRLFGAHALKYLFSPLKLGQIPNPSIEKCQARFGYKEYRPLIGYQRKRFLEILQGSPDFLIGKIPIEAYNKEVRNVKAVLSPFGWGEVCFRDFEAILNGCVLVKPDMDHVETWPEIFIKDTTYLRVNWDGSDIIENVQNLFKDDFNLEKIRTTAWNELKIAYSQLDDRILMIIGDFESD